MSELSELYQQVILDHNKKPRNFRKLETANRSAEGYNPLCGDQLNIYLQVEDDQLKDVSFEGSGCAISKASASMMTQAVKGKSKQEAELPLGNWVDGRLMRFMEIRSRVSSCPDKVCASMHNVERNQ